eukprot:1193698-Amorphochlora_amoeboformis.AAC.1
MNLGLFITGISLTDVHPIYFTATQLMVSPKNPKKLLKVPVILTINDGGLEVGPAEVKKRLNSGSLKYTYPQLLSWGASKSKFVVNIHAVDSETKETLHRRLEFETTQGIISTYVHLGNLLAAKTPMNVFARHDHVQLALPVVMLA